MKDIRTIDDNYEHLIDYIAEKFNTNREDLFNSDGNPNSDCGIIYVFKIQDADILANELTKKGLKCKAFHAGIKKEIRSKIQYEFMSGEFNVIVQTCAFGMGVDKKTVRAVVHWSESYSVNAYYQESGRVGRDGQLAFALMLFSHKENENTRYLLERKVNGEIYHIMREEEENQTNKR